MKIYKIEYQSKRKFDYYPSEKSFQPGNKVVLDTSKGLQLGVVICENKNFKFDESKKIVRKATVKDIKQFNQNIKDSKTAIKKASQLAKKLELNMKFVESEFNLDRTQLVLTFTADSRVDFRVLAKELAALYKTRIELRQIGIRDKARNISGVGQCGRKLCCSSFLNNLSSVSISMVKNQNLSLNPNKINGQCGRLLCCLTYEDEIYSQCKRGLPKVGDVVETDYGKVKVTFVDILNRSYSATNENGDKITIKLEKNCDKCEKSC